MTTVTERLCRGCDGPLPPKPRYGADRVWCTERCRKSQYAGECVDCGAPTNGSNGRENAPERCVPCRMAKQRADTRWTREAIVDAIRRWAATFGQPPTATDWNAAQARAHGHPEMAARYEAFDCPCQPTVHAAFGTWNAAITAAGFAPVAPGHYRAGRPGEDADLCRGIAARYMAGESVLAMAREYGCSPTAITYRAVSGGARQRTRAEVADLYRERAAA